MQLSKHMLPGLIAKLSGKLLKSEGEFARLIKKRIDIFWKAKDVEITRSICLSESDPLEKWKEGENWQRKLSNKYNAREFVRKYDCRVAELYWKGRNISGLNFENLPDQFVIRPTLGHSSRFVFLINNGYNLMDGKTYQPEDFREIMTSALDQKKNNEFLVEEFLKTEEGLYKIPADYKFYTFNGNIASIQVVCRLNSVSATNTCYDVNWNPMPNLTSNYPPGQIQKPPECLPEMIDYAKRLSKAYEIFCRIDLYATHKGAVFGEFTATPAAGDGFTPAGNKLLRAYWDKYCKGMI